MYQNFIGIDIGKNDFFVALHTEKLVDKYSNNLKGFRAFQKKYNNFLPNSLVVLETTGGYERPLITFLQKQRFFVHRANTRKVKSFIRSYGRLGKSDTIDALELARYGAERHASLPLFTEYEDEDLRDLVCRQRDLKRILVQEKNRRQAPGKKKLEKSFDSIINALKREIEKLDGKIKTLCSQKKLFNQKIDVLKTIAGIGDTIAIEILALMPELGKVNRKEIASLGNLAPHPNESGNKIGYRRTRGGRQTIKPILFMAAMAATRSHSELGLFYQKLVSAGKKKMVALTALMRKILVIANARLRDFYLNEKNQFIQV